MYIPIIYAGPFPYGYASANRVLSYAVEMAKMGHEVQVLSLVTYDQPFTGEEKADLEKRCAIKYKGIDVQYVSGREFWPVKGGKLKKVFLLWKGYRGARRSLLSRKGEFSSIMMLSSDILEYCWFSATAKKCGAKLIVERAELPSIEQNKAKYESSLIGRLFIWLTKKAFKKPDAWIMETQNLVDYYIPLGKRDAPYLIVPMTVDIPKYSAPIKTESPYSPYIAYCGNMSEEDGVSILIKAFRMVASKCPEYKLVLAGDSPAVPAQKKLVSELGIEKKVIFLGRIPSDSVPQFLKNASFLALASPTSERSVATMPCKVGEYLCTSNPVIVTNLGEIPKYLTDKESAFLPAADSPEKFADELEKAINTDAETLVEIGQKGYEVAVKNFNSEIQAGRIVSFLKELSLI